MISGQGLIVSEDVKAGTLLMASKAYAIGSSSGIQDFSLLVCIDLITNTANRSTQARCIVDAVQKLRRNPQTAEEVYSLYAGEEDAERVPPPAGVIDSGRIERIHCYNAFMPTPIPTNDDDHKQLERPEGGFLDTDPTGLWLLPSFFNHSCLGNVNRVFYGDMLFAYAICDLTKGEELTIPYSSPMQPYKSRVNYLNKWRFSCDCRLCQLDSADPGGEELRAELGKKIGNIK